MKDVVEVQTDEQLTELSRYEMAYFILDTKTTTNYFTILVSIRVI